MSMYRREFLKTGALAATGVLLLPTLPQLMAATDRSQYTIAELMGKSHFPPFGDHYVMREEASAAFARMSAAALEAGIGIYATSSYRNYEHQKSIWNRKYVRFTGQGLSPIDAMKKIIEYSTIPGTSRHHWGTDVDITDSKQVTPRDALLAAHYRKGGRYEKLFFWLKENAESFGFYEVYTDDPKRKGFKYEPWHYSYKPLSLPMLAEYKEKVDILKELQGDKTIKGHQYLTKEFLDQYRIENVLDIRKELLPA